MINFLLTQTQKRGRTAPILPGVLNGGELVRRSFLEMLKTQAALVSP
jgi:hypothetical protein